MKALLSRLMALEIALASARIDLLALATDEQGDYCYAPDGAIYRRQTGESHSSFARRVSADRGAICVIGYAEDETL